MATQRDATAAGLGRAPVRRLRQAACVLAATRQRTRAWLQRGQPASPASSADLKGRVWRHSGGRVEIAEGACIDGRLVRVELAAWPGGEIVIGPGTMIASGASISAFESVRIGRDCRIDRYVIINDNDYHDIEDRWRRPPSRPVVLEDRVHLCAGAIVLKGVRIGHDAVVGPGSVVTRDIPPGSIAAGYPARVLKPRAAWQGVPEGAPPARSSSPRAEGNA